MLVLQVCQTYIEQIQLWLTQPVIVNLILLFLFNLLSTTVNNLKTIFIIKGIMHSAYITTFIDAAVFAYAFQLISMDASITPILVFAIARVTGLFVGKTIETKLAIGTIEVTIQKYHDEGIELADSLRLGGYSVSSIKSYGPQGKPRRTLTVVAPRRHLDNIIEIVNEFGKANIAVKDVTATYGKMGIVKKES